MVANSVNKLPSILQYVFFDREPDWAQTVDFSAECKTLIFGALNTAEQRARKRLQPRLSVSFTLSCLELDDYTARRSSALTELRKPLVVPLWTEQKTISSIVSATEFGMSNMRSFKVGSFAYVVQDGLTPVFARITAIGSTLVIDAGDTVPDPLPTFTAGAFVYPCIIGMRNENSAGFVLINPLCNNETFNAVEL